MASIRNPCPGKVTVIVAGDEMTIDLSEVAREVNAPMNSGRSGGGETVSRLAFRYVSMPEATPMKEPSAR